MAERSVMVKWSWVVSGGVSMPSFGHHSEFRRLMACTVVLLASFHRFIIQGGSQRKRLAVLCIESGGGDRQKWSCKHYNLAKMRSNKLITIVHMPSYPYASFNVFSPDRHDWSTFFGSTCILWHFWIMLPCVALVLRLFWWLDGDKFSLAKLRSTFQSDKNVFLISFPYCVEIMALFLWCHFVDITEACWFWRL